VRERDTRIVSVAGVLAAAFALAILWSYMVPILEASDENDHFDYAISLAHAGHLIPAWTSAPYPSYDLQTDFLETYTDFPRINLNLHDRVPPGYGTHEYFEQLDRRAALQLPDPWKFEATAHNPTLLPFYPFGFYALLAMWIRSFAAFHHSLVATFFAARWFSIALLPVTLAFSYGIARELRLRPWLSLALTAVIGMFTLTTFVASYVQPDNLTWMLYTIITFLALRIRRHFSYAYAFAIGLALALLAITKYQYFAVMLAVLVALLGVRLARPFSLLRTLAVAALLLLPSGLTLLTQALLVGSNPSFAAIAVAHFTAKPSGTLSPTLFGFVSLCGQAIWHFFIAGFNYELDADPHFSGATSYWGDSGWLDTPLSFGSVAINTLVHLTIQTLNCITIALSVIWLSRTAYRLVRLAIRGRIWTALNLAVANVPLNLYFVFIAFMVFFYALTDNEWRISGRTWIPVIEPAFLLGFYFAPRALGRMRWRAPYATAILVLLALYATVGSFFGAVSAQQRYYGRDQLPHLSELTRGPKSEIVVDTVSTTLDPPRRPVDATGAFIAGVRQGQQIEITGWAGDIINRSAAGGVIAVVDGRDEIAASYGYATEYVSKELNALPLFWAGYHFHIPTLNVGYGAHTIALYIVSKDLKTYYPTGRNIRFIVDPPRPIVIGDAQHIVGSLDQVGTIQTAGVDGSEYDPVWLDRDGYLALRGWADDVIHKQAIARIVLTIDGNRTFEAHLGDFRPELARDFPQLPPQVAMFSGFTAVVPLHALSEGTHVFSLRAIDGEAGGSVSLIRDFAFGVAGSDSPGAIIEPAYITRPFRFGDRKTIDGKIDVVGSISQVPAERESGAVWLDRAGYLYIRGWGINRAERRPLRQITITLDGTHRYAMRMNGFRPDLPDQLRSVSPQIAAYLGFSAAVPMHDLATGTHLLTMTAVDGEPGHLLYIVRNFPFVTY